MLFRRLAAHEAVVLAPLGQEDAVVSSIVLPRDMDAGAVLGHDDDVIGFDVPEHVRKVDGRTRPGQIRGI
jgi:hypothetical protein